MGLILKNTLSIKDMVVAITDLDGVPRVITGIMVRPAKLEYECSHISLVTGEKVIEYFADFELEKVESLNINLDEESEGEEE